MASSQENEAIAIVGMACRFPGNAESTSLLWAMLNDGASAWGPFPKDRMNTEGFFHPSTQRNDSFNFTGAHFLKSNVAAFDASFFGVAAKEAEAIDPQQRILLEVSYEALENAGIPHDTYYGSKTCVFVGSFVKDYEQISMRDAMTAAPDCATGNGIAIMANRISYVFNMGGTSQTIDTGCSASLIAVHQAVNNIRSGQSDMALAGGAGLILTPATIMPMTSLGFLSKDGKSYTFDDRANGYGRGEGVGMVVLKRLSDALRDNDTIRGVIRGTASNQDGRTPGITVPNPEAQVKCIKEAYANANLDLDSTLYVECHGTGTKAGDYRELKAISTAFCPERKEPIYVGSAKPNIGHLEGAAGIAGMMRALLILENGKIPPHINFERWNPDIKHEEWKVDITLQGLDFGHDKLNRVSVNCFGFGGTNAHAVIDSGRSFLREKGLHGNHNVADKSARAQSPSWWTECGRPQLFVFSAQHAEGVKHQMASLAKYLGEKKDTNTSSSPVFLRDLAYTLYDRRSAFRFRDFVTAENVSQLDSLLTADRVSNKALAGTEKKKAMKTVFVFAGQGAQWARMGIDLLGIAPFRESMELSKKFISSRSDLDLLDELAADVESSHVDEPVISQPTTTAIQIALVDLLEWCGITPSAVVGHSSGEIAAAYAAGLISRHTALTLALERGLAAAAVNKDGLMLAAAMSESDANRVIAKVDAQHPEGRVVVACVNGPARVTLSGDKDKMLAVQAALLSSQAQARLLKVNTAYHSHHMEEVSNLYADSIKHTENDACPGQKCPMFSSVRDGIELQADMMTPDYWVENMVRPVKFDKAVTGMLEFLAARDGMPDFIIEVSPRSQLHGPVIETLQEAGVSSDTYKYHAIMSRKSKSTSELMPLFGEMWKAGHKLKMDVFFALDQDQHGPTKKCLVDLPRYPWDHSRTYWAESHVSRRYRFRQFGRQDLIGAPTPDSVIPQEPCWRGFFRLHEMPWMGHHRVQGEIVYPAAGMVAMAIQGGWQVFQEFANKSKFEFELVDFEVSKFSIKAPMIIPDDEEGLEHAINAKRVEESEVGHMTVWMYKFAVYSKPGPDPPFVEHATGFLRVRFINLSKWPWMETAVFTARKMPVEDLDGDHTTPFEFYEGLDVIGMQYGPTFRNMASISEVQTVNDKKCCLTIMTIPDTAAVMPERYEFPHVVHPATLDTMFQSIFALGSEPMVPYYIESVRVSASIPTDPATSFIMETSARQEGRFEVRADVEVLDPWAEAAEAAEANSQSRPRPQHRQLVKIKGLRAKALPSAGAGDALRFLPSHRHLCSEVQWKPDVDQAGLGLGGDLGGDLASWLALLGHKKPGLSILHVGRDERMIKTVFSALAPGSDDAANPLPLSLVGGYTVVYDDDDDNDGLDMDALRSCVPSGRESHLHAVKKSTVVDEWIGEAAPSFDLVVQEMGTSLVISAERLVRFGGFLLTLSPASGVTCLHHQGTDKGLTAVGSPVMHHDLEKYLHLYSKPVEYEVPDGCNIYILAHTDDKHTRENLGPLMVALQSHDQVSVEVVGPDWLETVNLEDDESESGRCLISLFELADSDSPTGILFDMDEHVFGQVKKMMELSKKLLWVTAGAQMQCDKPYNAIFQGWSRTVRSEDGQKKLVTVDMNGASIDTVGSRIARICMHSFFAGAQETEYCLDAKHDFIPRLIPLTDMNHVIEHGLDGDGDGAVVYEQKDLSAEGHFRLAMANPGDIRSLCFTTDVEATRALRPHEVRIAVRHTIILPVDLETAKTSSARELGVGLDVHGTVLELGPDCAASGVAFSVGDAVVGMARGTVRTAMVLTSSMVRPCLEHHGQRLPAVWSPTMVSTVLAIITGLGQVLDGSEQPRVLLLGGQQPYGQLFRRIWDPAAWNVELCVVVGHGRDDDGQAFEHESSIHDDDFLAERVEALQGFDVVIDLSFEGHSARTDCVRDGGWLIQFRNTNTSSTTELDPWQPARIHVTSLDPFHMSPGRMDLAFKHVASQPSRVRDSYMMAVPGQVCTLSNAVGLLQHLERKPDAGGWSLVERVSRQDMARVACRPAHMDGPGLVLDPKAAYLVVGGLGGLGQDMVMWLASKGAKHVVVASRSGLPLYASQGSGPPHGSDSHRSDSHRSDSWRRVQRALADVDAVVHDLKVDICDYDKLREALSALGKDGVPAVAGCIHAAGVLHDSTYRNMTHAAWTAAARVKTRGSWNLHRLLPAGMAFLVFLSSAAGVIGNRGQANYAAGNAFQDALARHRSAQGMHAVSLDLGPVLGRGMVDQDMMDLLRGVGFFGVRRRDVHYVLERALVSSAVTSAEALFPPQVVMGVGTGGLIRQNRPADPFWAHTALFAHLNRLDVEPSSATTGTGDDGAGGDGLALLDLRPRLKRAGSAEEAVEVLLEPLLAALVAAIPNLARADVRPDMTPADVGSDSMRGVAVDSWLRRTTGVSIGQGINALPIRKICEDVVRKGAFLEGGR